MLAPYKGAVALYIARYGMSEGSSNSISGFRVKEEEGAPFPCYLRHYPCMACHLETRDQGPGTTGTRVAP